MKQVTTTILSAALIAGETESPEIRAKLKFFHGAGTYEGLAVFSFDNKEQALQVWGTIFKPDNQVVSPQPCVVFGSQK